ncbi:response regulator transcription factor [Echinicola jeungdonensis]|uniref:Response regulator transcription factor n=1 Tax=Echinicola jeungdonensis TaxID=709343 RepID=A0ABV5J6K0_9BACT|nr:response regulator transcription factor [Echinicola jeungdonensis]MDN3669289.1 response regulator transcription factor [Echinicola jeungdonensis]
MKKVLVIEDDLDIAELISIHLKDLECEMIHIENGDEGFSVAINGTFDLILLDLMLPGMSGEEICASLRKEGVNTPIMMVTAKSEEMDRVTGLELGADVYITKPFSVLEFKARVKALFRRIKIAQEEKSDPKKKIRYNHLEINLDGKFASLYGERLCLTPKEFELLALLATHPGKSFSRKKLLQLVWDYDYQGFEHTVNSHINRLRTKIEKDMQHPEYILTSWGIGYRFAD